MTDWILGLIERAGYLGVAFLMFLETVFPPIPSELIMPLAGVEAAKGSMRLPLVILSGTVGAMLGNLGWYLVARRLGRSRLRAIVERHGRWLTVSWPDVERAEALFRRRGWAFVCLGRLVPTIRSLVSLPAGLLRMRLVPFLFWSTVGSASWSALLGLAGFRLGQDYGNVSRFIGPVSAAVVVGIVVLYVYRIATWRSRA